MERLNFELPSFCRTSWVSSDSKELWEPRIRSVQDAYANVEVVSPAGGIRSAAFVYVSPEQLIELALWAAENEVAALPFDRNGMATYSIHAQGPRERQDYAFRVIVARPRTALELRRRLAENDTWAIGELLGVPACCREFFQSVWMERSYVDTTWEMARNAPQDERHQHSLVVGGPATCNILLRWIGIRAVPHLPCSFICEGTRMLGERFIELGRRLGLSNEMNWLEEILSWPMTWSAKNGIAEIRTPVFKMSVTTDPTPITYHVEREGTSFPEEGAKGLVAPYLMPRMRNLTASRSYIAGLAAAGGDVRGSLLPADATIEARVETLLIDADFFRLGEPQEDGYDTDVFRAVMLARGWDPKIPEGDPTFFDGRVGLGALDKDRILPENTVLDTGHPSISWAERCVNAWPAMNVQFPRLIHRVCPLRRHDDRSDHVTGSFSGGGDFGEVYMQVDNRLGFAVSLVHELGHHKLRALGVHMEACDRLLKNDPSKVYPSPIRLDKPRPLAAVLHAQYSFTHVLHLCNVAIALESDAMVIHKIVRTMIGAKVPRLTYGLVVLRRYAKPDKQGEAFLEGFYSWCERVLAQGRRWLEHTGAEAEEFQHPFAALIDDEV